jgi:hypothetical protein
MASLDLLTVLQKAENQQSLSIRPASAKAALPSNAVLLFILALLLMLFVMPAAHSASCGLLARVWRMFVCSALLMMIAVLSDGDEN